MACFSKQRGGFLLTSLAVAVGVTGCQFMGERSVVTKTVVVRPVEKGTRQVVDANPQFLGAADHFRLADLNRKFDAPLVWHTEVDPGGGMRITWTSRLGAKERLFLAEAGFHPVEVPLDQALVIDGQGSYSRPRRVVTLEMSGNTAYLPKHARVSYRRGRYERERTRAGL
jgi:hypothetical protein